MSAATKISEPSGSPGIAEEHVGHAIPHHLVSPVAQKWIEEGKQDPEGFWGRAADQLPWFRKWDKVLEWNPPTFNWYVGGQTNLAYNALDHHVKRGWGGHTALVYINERGERRVYTYAHLLHEVQQVAKALRGMGIKKGDRLTVYMPTSPEAIILMLATVRIGAIHSVVFAGFGAKALGDRVQASGSRLVFTADVTYRKGKDTRLKEIVDEALQNAGDKVEHVIVLKRTAGEVPMHPGRDLLWEQFLEHGAGESGDYVVMEANEPAFILATSGTTQHGAVVVCPEAYRCLVVDLRHWMDRGTQLHRVRSANRRRNHYRLRRRTGPSDPRWRLENADGGVLRHRNLHFTHRGPIVDAVWGRAVRRR